MLYIYFFFLIAYFAPDVIGEPFPILRSLVYVHHPVEVAGIELTTFGLRDTTTTMSPPDEDKYIFCNIVIYNG